MNPFPDVEPEKLLGHGDSFLQGDQLHERNPGAYGSGSGEEPVEKPRPWGPRGVVLRLHVWNEGSVHAQKPIEVLY